MMGRNRFPCLRRKAMRSFPGSPRCLQPATHKMRLHLRGLSNSVSAAGFTRFLFNAMFCLLLAAPLAAQRQKPEPLTEKQQEQIAESGIDPVGRVNLYVKFLNNYADTIKGLTARARSSARAVRLDNELQNFSSLMDELGDNLDTYSGRKADIRMSLKGLNESIAHWQQVLHELPSEPVFALSLKDAAASAGDLADQAQKLTAGQEAYFKAHPKEKGQDRWEPQ